MKKQSNWPNPWLAGFVIKQFGSTLQWERYRRAQCYTLERSDKTAGVNGWKHMGVYLYRSKDDGKTFSDFTPTVIGPWGV